MSLDAVERMILRDLMDGWPQTVPVFVRRRMNCPSCLMAPFMTVSEAAREYGYAPEELARDLARVIRPDHPMA